MGDSIDCNQKQILVGTHKKGENLLIYDLGTRKLLNNIEWETGTQMEGVNIYTAQFSKFNSDTIVAGATGFNQLKIFENKEKGKQIFCANSIPKGCFTVDYGNNSRNIAFGGGEGYIYLCGIYA